MNIQDYNDLVAFENSSEFNIEVEKKASFKDSVNAFRKNTTVKAIDALTSHEISKYEHKNKDISKKINKYPAATIPAEPNSKGKVFGNIKRLERNLDIIFTPFSVIITVKRGTQKLTIQTIEVEKMPDIMRAAWQKKDASFFKRYMSAKMEYSAQLAKQRFILDGIKSSIDFQETFSKNASELCEEVDDEIPFFNIVFFGEKYAEMNDEIFEKLADISCVDNNSVFISPVDNNDAFLEVCASMNSIPVVVDEEYYKEASKIITPEQIKSKGKIIFLTDRVILCIGADILTSIFADNMSKEMYSAFEKKDKVFFKKLFERQATIYNQRLAYYGNKSGIEKKAFSLNSIFSISKMFTLDFIHPFVFYNVMNKKFGKRWVDFDEFVIIKEVEEKFKTPVICNSALNKILSIAAINSKETKLCFESVHAFEKIIRSFCDLPIDFEQRETDSIDAKNIMYGLQCMSMCHNGDSIYSNFSSDVLSYIVDRLLDDNMYAFYPSVNKYTKEDEEEQLEFLSIINRSLLESIIKRDIDAILDAELEAETAKNDEIVQSTTIASLDFMRSGEAHSAADIEQYVVSCCKKFEVEDRFIEFIKNQVQKNFEIDLFLKNKTDNLNVYLGLYGIK